MNHLYFTNNPSFLSLTTESKQLVINQKCFKRQINIFMGFDVERTDDQVIIRMPLSSLPEDIEDVLNYFKYVQLGKSSVITDEDVDYFVEKSRGSWWRENKDRFKDVPGFERFQ